MKAPRLALLGGSPVIKKSFQPYVAHSRLEVKAAKRVLESGVLSGFYGSAGPYFNGGKEVRAFEEEWAEKFKIKHAISVNSWTSGLEVCFAALDLPRGSEVIVPSWTMSATVSAIVHAGLVPVFADVSEDSYCITVETIRQVETLQTRAIAGVDIFGLSADWQSITRYAKSRGWWTVSDSAQAPGVMTPNGFVGTFADIGGYSLNYHKHIHTGEGGMVVTNDDSLAERSRLLRNHGEAVVGAHDSHRFEQVGHNFRLGEVEAAIGRVQLSRMNELVGGRMEKAQELRNALLEFSGLKLPDSQNDSTNAFYVLPFQANPAILGVERHLLVNALKAEGLEIMASYLTVHRMPFFSRNFPTPKLEVTERLQDTTFLGLQICQFDFSPPEIQQVIDVFDKVWNGLEL